MTFAERLVAGVDAMARFHQRWHWITASVFLLLALALLATAVVQGAWRSALLGMSCLAWAVAHADPHLLQPPRAPQRSLPATTRVAFAIAMGLGGVVAVLMLAAGG